METLKDVDKSHMKRVRKLWEPSLWASLKPFGLGEQHPNNFKEISRALVENRDEAAYAWRILSQGVCDGCALGVAGLHDWTMDGPHLCNIRLRLLRMNTMPALDIAMLADVAPLRKKKSAQLRELGRLPYPMIRHRGEPGRAAQAGQSDRGRAGRSCSSHRGAASHPRAAARRR